MMKRRIAHLRNALAAAGDAGALLFLALRQSPDPRGAQLLGVQA